MVSRMLAAATVFVLACGDLDDLGALVPPTAEQDPRVPQTTLDIAGHRRAVHVESFGDPASPPLLVLHGSLGDHRALRPLASLADRYFVVMWDQRGNGLSERITADEYTWDSVVDEVAAIADLYAPGRPLTLVGHSFGAMYATLFASRRPERVAQLALLEPAGLNGRIFQETYGSIINVNLFDPDMNRMFWQNQLLTPTSHEAMDYRALMILLNGRQTNYYCDPDRPPQLPVWRPGAYVEYLRGLRMGTKGGFSAPKFSFDFAAGLETFGPKVLIVAGTCSALGPEFQRKYHLALFRDVQIVPIANVGHRMFVERPEAVLQALRGYLRAYAPP